MPKTSSLPQLSIIIVNWNCLAFTLECIRSLEETTRNIDCEVIVIDNASRDAPCSDLVAEFPSVKLILSDRNLGFGRANNLGLKHAVGQYLLFLNPDTLVKADSVLRMHRELAARPHAGAMGCRLLNPDGTLQTTCTFVFPTITNQLLAIDWLQQRWPALPLWGKQALYSNDGQSVHEVQVAPGAAIMIPRHVFESVGGFNPDYFMYAEEVDLCLAIRRAGYSVLHLADAEIIHFGGQSTNKCEDGFATVLMCDSVYRFFRRTHGRMYAILYRALLSANALCRLVILGCAAPLPFLFPGRVDRNFLSKAHRKWWKIAFWTIGRNSYRQEPPSRSIISITAVEP